MPTPEAGRILATKLGSAVCRLVRGRSSTNADDAVTGTVLTWSAAGGPTQLALAPARDPDRLGCGLEESGRQAPGLLIKAEEPSQRFIQLRRGEDPEQASYEILAPMGSVDPESDADSEASTAAREGVSAFIARVLNQLQLSAWLPAAFVTASVAVLLEFRSKGSANILAAVQKLTADPAQVLVIMIPLLVIATMVTQAFSFEAIRSLEGYWRRRGLASLASRIMIRRHVRRKRSIIERKHKESAKALRAAIPDIIFDKDISSPVVRALVATLSGRESEAPDLEGKELEVFVSTIQSWRNSAEAWRLARVDRLIAEENRYPVNSRILPTKLGNLLRATEDGLQHANADVQSFVLRRRDTVSRRVQMQHDQFRTRLDMYCTLVFVCAFLLAVTPIILAGHIGTAAIAITVGSFAAMGMASYLAAIASAEGYCTALKQMDAAAVAAASAEK